MNRKTFFVGVVVSGLIVLAGCTRTPTIFQQNAHELERVRIGMSPTELKQAVPNASRVGAWKDEEYWELSGYESGNSGACNRETIRFVFVNEKLQQWGERFAVVRDQSMRK